MKRRSQSMKVVSTKSGEIAKRCKKQIKFKSNRLPDCDESEYKNYKEVAHFPGVEPGCDGEEGARQGCVHVMIIGEQSVSHGSGQSDEKANPEQPQVIMRQRLEIDGDSSQS